MVGVIIFFGQGYVLSLVNIIITPFISAGSYSMIFQAYIWIYVAVLVLIISGVVMFYRGRKESGNQPTSSANVESE